MNLRDPFRFRAVARLADKPVARSSVRVLQFIGEESQRSRLPQMAAALSYRTLFGLLPMVIVALVGLRFFISDVQIDEFVNRTLQYAGLDVITVPAVPPPSPAASASSANDESAFWGEPLRAPEPNGATDTPASPPNATSGSEGADGGAKSGGDGSGGAPENEAVEPPVVTPAEVSRSELVETIRSLISRAKSIDYRAVGIAGAITLIYAAISMLTEVERAFNQIFRVPVGKPWRRRMTEYWALLTLGTPCLLATFYVGERAKGIVASTVESAGLSASGVVGIALSGYAITVLISAALLVMAYVLLPNTRVRFVPALAGALLAAILWEAGKWGFTQYLRYSTNYARLYGSIALIPLFLLWIYSTWAIVLLGLHVTYHIQMAREGKNAKGQPVNWTLPASGVVDPSTAVAIAHAAARGFFSGTPVSMSAMVESTGAPAGVVADIVARLVESRVLHRVTTPEDAHAVALAMPPERIKVRDVLEIGYELAGPTSPAAENSGERLLPGVRARLRDTHLRATGSTTMADLLTSVAGPLGAATSNNAQPLPGPDALDTFGSPETDPGSDANPYPHVTTADTLPLVDQGDPARDQESDRNSLDNGDPAHRAVRDPGVL